jgi:hypothetical protein
MVRTFPSAREAKEFLVSKIVTESQREGVPLSEVERKMLYFSETAWTLQDMAAVNEAFDREYNQAENEQKIGKLIRNMGTSDRAHNREEFEDWNEAPRTLRQEDHYLLVLIAAAESSSLPAGAIPETRGHRRGRGLRHRGSRLSGHEPIVDWVLDRGRR